MRSCPSCRCSDFALWASIDAALRSVHARFPDPYRVPPEVMVEAVLASSAAAPKGSQVTPEGTFDEAGFGVCFECGSIVVFGEPILLVNEEILAALPKALVNPLLMAQILIRKRGPLTRGRGRGSRELDS